MKVSIAVTTYNHEKFIAASLLSCISQECSGFDLEVVVGEDCSTDSTRSILQTLAQQYSQIKPIFHVQNVGAKNNLISVLKACTGDFICILDGDDILFPKKCITQFGVMMADNSVSLVAHNMRVVSDTGEERGVFFNPALSGRFSLDDIVKRGTFFPNTSVMYRASALKLDEVLPDSYPYCGDWMNHVQVTRYGDAIILNDVLGDYVKHSNSLSAQNKKRSEAVFLEGLEMISRMSGYKQIAKDSLVVAENRVRFDYALRSLFSGDYLTFRSQMNCLNTQYLNPGTMFKVYTFRFFPRLLSCLLKLKRALA